MSWIADSLRAHVELALFLALGMGNLIGRLHIRRFKLGAAIGVLLAGVAIGQAGIDVPTSLEWSFFLLFLFSVGYKTGPQFFQGLGRSALSQVGLALLFCATGVGTAYTLAHLFGFDAGTGAGIFAGGLDASAAIGTATDAIAHLPDAAARHRLATSATVAFAVTYLAGMTTSIITLAKIGPWLMRIDLPAECRKLESELGIDTSNAGQVSAYQRFVARSYVVPEGFEGKTAAQFEQTFAPARVFVERVRTAHGVIDAEPDTVLHTGSRVTLSGPSELLVGNGMPRRLQEVQDSELLDIPLVTVDHVLTRRDFRHRTLAQIAEILAQEVATRGVFVRSVSRSGQELPLGPGLLLENGDELKLTGAHRHVERVAAKLGSVVWPSMTTNMAILGLAVAIGGLVGVPALHLGRVHIGLSAPVGVLLGGLAAGWLCGRYAVFGRVPEAALSLLDSLGLSAFLGLVGIGAGPEFAHGVRTSGIALFAAGILVCIIPNLLTMCAGRYLLHIHPGVLLGICAGAGTAPAALAALQEASHSQVPMLGYGVSYAVGNILLAISGSIMVAILAGG
jgi:putative transport protein